MRRQYFSLLTKLDIDAIYSMLSTTQQVDRQYQLDGLFAFSNPFIFDSGLHDNLFIGLDSGTCLSSCATIGFTSLLNKKNKAVQVFLKRLFSKEQNVRLFWKVALCYSRLPCVHPIFIHDVLRMGSEVVTNSQTGEQHLEYFIYSSFFDYKVVDNSHIPSLIASFMAASSSTFRSSIVADFFIIRCIPENYDANTISVQCFYPVSLPVVDVSKHGCGAFIVDSHKYKKLPPSEPTSDVSLGTIPKQFFYMPCLNSGSELDLDKVDEIYQKNIQFFSHMYSMFVSLINWAVSLCEGSGFYFNRIHGVFSGDCFFNSDTACHFASTGNCEMCQNHWYPGTSMMTDGLYPADTFMGGFISPDLNTIQDMESAFVQAVFGAFVLANYVNDICYLPGQCGALVPTPIYMRL